MFLINFSSVSLKADSDKIILRIENPRLSVIYKIIKIHLWLGMSCKCSSVARWQWFRSERKKNNGKKGVYSFQIHDDMEDVLNCINIDTKSRYL